MIELTNHCQLKCFICAREYQFGRDMDKGHMDFVQFKKLIQENHIYLDRIGLTGLGETLLYPQIIEAVEYIRSLNKGISIFISTNAYPKNAPEIMSKIADKIDTLQISLDGIGSVFEHIRKKSNYNLYYDNLKKLTGLSHHKRMAVKFNMVVFEENYKQMKDVINLAHSLNVNELFFNTFNLVATDLDLNRYNFYKTPEFLNEFDEALQSARDLGIYIGYHDLTMPKGFEHCPYPWDDFYITWDGYLVPCCAKPFPKVKNFGNVFTNGLMPPLNSKEYIDFRNLSKQNITPDFCRGCHKLN
ncbi:MAG: radical SAM protein [Calditrichaceae bacterium]|nr:radical SAM protein [Calditrichaceae bacterium]